MESSFTYCSQWVIADCFFLTLVMSSTDVIISCILTNWAGKKRKNSQKYNTVLMSRIFLEKNEPLWVWFLGHEEKWGINSKLGALSSLTCSTYTKIGTIQRRLAWPLRKDDTQIREAFHIFQTKFFLSFVGNVCRDGRWERKISQVMKVLLWGQKIAIFCWVWW